MNKIIFTCVALIVLIVGNYFFHFQLYDNIMDSMLNKDLELQEEDFAYVEMYEANPSENLDIQLEYYYHKKDTIKTEYYFNDMNREQYIVFSVFLNFVAVVILAAIISFSKASK